MASLLAVATIFVGLWTLNIYILQSEMGGGLIRETKLPMQELEPKMQGRLICEGGRTCGILRYLKCQYFRYAMYHMVCQSQNGVLSLEQLS
jgi:hypothetical protein